MSDPKCFHHRKPQITVIKYLSKEEFDSETKQEGRSRTNEEQDLSVADFNKIQLTELNTKGIICTLYR